MAKYPAVFKPGGILEQFPFLLPNLAATAQCALSVLVGLLFLEESHEVKKHDRDRGRELGQWLVRKLDITQYFRRSQHASAQSQFNETSALLGPNTGSAYTSHGAPSRKGNDIVNVSGNTRGGSDEESRKITRKISMREALTPQVLLVVGSYGLLAL